MEVREQVLRHLASSKTCTANSCNHSKPASSPSFPQAGSREALLRALHYSVRRPDNHNFRLSRWPSMTLKARQADGRLWMLVHPDAARRHSTPPNDT